MNKFFTRFIVVILVLVEKGIVWGEMTTDVPYEAGSLPNTTETTSGLPKVLDLSRYGALGKKSPFTLASATAEADFAKDLVLGGYVRMDGEDFVMVANKMKPDRILVGMKPSPAAQGMILMELKKDPSGDPSKIQAKIKKGTEMATLKYESIGGDGAPAATIPPPTPSQPQVLGQPVQAQVNPGPRSQNRPAQVSPITIRRRSVEIPAGSTQ